jgi:hypothetical protein
MKLYTACLEESHDMLANLATVAESKIEAFENMRQELREWYNKNEPLLNEMLENFVIEDVEEADGKAVNIREYTGY